jgi:hypothetical protein
MIISYPYGIERIARVASVPVAVVVVGRGEGDLEDDLR